MYLDARSERPPDPRRAEWYDAFRSGRGRAFYEEHVVDDDELAQGLCDGSLAWDFRLRDAIRSGAPSVDPGETDPAYLQELGALAEQDIIVRSLRRLEQLERRVAALEQHPLRRLGCG